MYNNTTSMFPTHFLRGTELIERATAEYDTYSENWPFPSQYRYGIPMDKYYAEVWINGMDYQANHWVIEEVDLEKPQAKPLFMFEEHSEEEKFSNHDFGMLIKAALYYRRDCVFIKHNDLGWYRDMVWPFLKRVDDKVEFVVMQKFVYAHASQPPVHFWMNPEFIPNYVLERDKNEKNRSDRNAPKGFVGGVEKTGADIISLI